jgi:hypothetical protein
MGKANPQKNAEAKPWVNVIATAGRVAMHKRRRSNLRIFCMNIEK